MVVAASTPMASFCPVKPQTLRSTLKLTAFASAKANPGKWVPLNSMKAIVERFGSGTGGAGLLEKPAFDQSQFDSAPQALEGGDIGSSRAKRGSRGGDSYRVLLVDDAKHTEKLVVKVLPQAVPQITADDARRLFHESRERGVAVVIVAVKEHAEFYAQMMIRGGLRSSIEPDSSSC